MTDIFNLLKPYLRGWLIILSFMIIGFFAASKYLNYVTPMYESTAKLRLADMSEGVPNSNLFKDLDVFVSSQKINAEIELIKSHSLISKALSLVPFEMQLFRTGQIQNTELFLNSPILIQPIEWEEKLKDKILQLKIENHESYTITTENATVYKGKIGDTLNIENSSLIINLNQDLLKTKKELNIVDNYSFSILSLSRQISEINKNLEINAVDKDIPVIRISYKSAHPEKAALFSNALAEAYISDYIQTKYSAANVTNNFLNERIEELSVKLSNSENDILNFRENEGITNIVQEVETDLRKVSQLKIQQTNLKMSLEAIKDLERYIQSGQENFLSLAPNFEAFTDLLSTEIIKNIKQLQAEKKDLLLQYTENAEQVKVVDAKIDDLTSYLTESITNTRKNLETKYNKLVNDISQAELVFIDVPQKEKTMKILNREFEIYQQSYNFLNQKMIEAGIAKSAKISFHRIISPAMISKTPVSPNRIIIKIVSTLLGMFAALFLIFVVHTLKARVNDRATIESRSLIPIVLAVPKLKSNNQAKKLFTKTVSEWEIKQLMNHKTITCFSGFNINEGAQFISNHIETIFKIQNRKVLLVVFKDEIKDNSEHFWTTEIESEHKTTITINETLLGTLTIEKWQNWLHENAENFDQTIILNTPFGTPFTLATMAASHLNIVCVDTRLTRAKKIIEVDLLNEEFNLPKVFYALNRDGYTPSLIRDCKLFFKNKIKRFKTKKNAIA